MKRQSQSAKKALASFGVLVALPANYVVEAALQDRQFELQDQRTRAALAEQLYAEWLDIRLQCGPAAETLLARKRKPYRLGLSGRPAPQGEQQLFCIVTYFEKVGGLIAAGRVSAGELSNYIGADARYWQDILKPFWERESQIPLVRNRHDQVGRAVATLAVIDGPISARPTHPAHVDFSVKKGWDRAEVSISLHNPNSAAIPSPGVCVECHNDARARVGEWILFPPTPTVGAGEVVAFTVTVPVDERGMPAYVRLVTASDFVFSSDDRFADSNAVPYQIS